MSTLKYENNSLSQLPVLEGFTNLQSLNLSRNKFTEIPKTITSLPSLRELIISHNELVTISEEVTQLKHLTRLDVSCNKIEQVDYTLLSKLSELQALKLEYNKIRTFDYKDLEKLTKLQIFYINGNYIETPQNISKSIVAMFPSAFFQKIPNKVDEHIYLGALDSTRDKDVLNERNITGILSLGVRPLLKQGIMSKKIAIQFISISDTPDENIIQYLPKCFKFIDSIIEKGGSVLIHCHAGISRSSSVLIAYYMYNKLWSYEETIEFVRKNRPIVIPNEGFEKQLIEFGQRIEDYLDDPDEFDVDENLDEAGEEEEVYEDEEEVDEEEDDL